MHNELERLYLVCLDIQTKYGTNHIRIRNQSGYGSGSYQIYLYCLHPLLHDSDGCKNFGHIINNMITLKLLIYLYVSNSDTSDLPFPHWRGVVYRACRRVYISSFLWTVYVAKLLGLKMKVKSMVSNIGHSLIGIGIIIQCFRYLMQYIHKSLSLYIHTHMELLFIFLNSKYNYHVLK